MSQELHYTSVPRGLKPGTRGYCTVAHTSGLPLALAERLEALSGYRQVFMPQDPNVGLNPVVFSHVRWSSGGRSYSILSRICYSGLDYTDRTNKYAHHVVLEAGERAPGGPAWLLAAPGFVQTAWEGEPRLLPPRPPVPPGDRPGGVCHEWARRTGDAGWAGVIAESFLADPRRPVYLVFDPGADVLTLFVEALALLPADRRWDVSFSTYFTGVPAGMDCVWRGVLRDSTEARQARSYPEALIIDLGHPAGRAEGRALVEQARTGVRPAPAPGPAPLRPHASAPVTTAQPAEEEVLDAVTAVPFEPAPPEVTPFASTPLPGSIPIVPIPPPVTGARPVPKPRKLQPQAARVESPWLQTPVLVTLIVCTTLVLVLIIGAIVFITASSTPRGGPAIVQGPPPASGNEVGTTHEGTTKTDPKKKAAGQGDRKDAASGDTTGEPAGAPVREATAGTSGVDPNTTLVGKPALKLRLMPSLDGVRFIPREGQNLMIVALVKDVLHFRSFDANGDKDIDINEQQLITHVGKINKLKLQLDRLWHLDDLTVDDKESVISAVDDLLRNVRYKVRAQRRTAEKNTDGQQAQSGGEAGSRTGNETGNKDTKRPIQISGYLDLPSDQRDFVTLDPKLPGLKDKVQSLALIGSEDGEIRAAIKQLFDIDWKYNDKEEVLNIKVKDIRFSKGKFEPFAVFLIQADTFEFQWKTAAFDAPSQEQTADAPKERSRCRTALRGCILEVDLKDKMKEYFLLGEPRKSEAPKQDAFPNVTRYLTSQSFLIYNPIVEPEEDFVSATLKKYVMSGSYRKLHINKCKFQLPKDSGTSSERILILEPGSPGKDMLVGPMESGLQVTVMPEQTNKKFLNVSVSIGPSSNPIAAQSGKLTDEEVSRIVDKLQRAKDLLKSAKIIVTFTIEAGGKTFQLPDLSLENYIGYGQ